MCDQIAVSVFKSLVKDFRETFGEGFATQAVNCLSRGIREYRAYVYPELGVVDAYRYKAWWQLQHFFKRYRFEDDVYSDEELEAKTFESWLQFTTARSRYTPLKLSTVKVLSEARKICRQILCLPFEAGQLVRNGIKSTRSVPLQKAFLDEKWGTVEGFDCPSGLRREFLELRKLPQGKPVVQRLLRLAKQQGKTLDLSADDLNLILVDKSWKARRPITPLSVFGLYWSFGLGGYVEACLRNVGLDIKFLQQTHKRLAKKYSSSRTHVTADLKNGSENIRADHLNRVLPRWFYVQIKKTFARTINYNGKKYATSSCLPMGNGATFPVETLYFYCLIKAIGNLLGVKGVYSVYGDDLIYPSRIHSYVINVFGDLGIGINGDKTFVNAYFRESCGGDYYRGVDVRPAMLPAERADVTRRLNYVSWLYKVTNALLKRWDPVEIPHTLKYLYSEIAYARGEIHQVPPSFPDTAGIHMSKPQKPTWLMPFVYPKVLDVSAQRGSCYLLVKFIGNDPPKRRLILYEDIYFHDALQRTANAELVQSTIQPPSYKEGWGRYKCPGMTKLLAKWFLKSLSFKEGEASQSDRKGRFEPSRDVGKTRIYVSKLTTWE